MFGYHICDTAFGYVAVLFEKDPFLITRVFLPCRSRRSQIGRIRTTASATATQTEEAKAFCRQIQAYFEGIPLKPFWECLDLNGLTSLQQRVLKTVGTIPYGSTQTYGQIARRIGRPRAYRFVGATMQRNPFPLVIPCHRVIRTDGSLGGFGGGVTLKKRLLALEKGSVLSKNKC
jgi:methylated-DNA-[protein]-cysteine S-methyltransferase